MNEVMLQLWSKYLVCRPHRSHSPFLTCLFEALCACFINAKSRRNAFIFEICCVVMSSCVFFLCLLQYEVLVYLCLLQYEVLVLLMSSTIRSAGFTRVWRVARGSVDARARAHGVTCKRCKMHTMSHALEWRQAKQTQAVSESSTCAVKQQRTRECLFQRSALDS
jgi:hypothetical protein